MSDFDRKFIFVTGKGGVGKTTVSVALGVALARAGRRVLLALTEQGQAGSLLGGPPLGSEIQTVSMGLQAVVLEPRAALREYAELVLPSGAVVGALMDNRYSRGFLAAVPGLYPWAMLGKAWYHATETQHGQPRFDHVIMDAPATGHGLEMLRVPKVIAEATAPGILRRDAERANALLRDPAQTAIVVVTLPELLPVLETRELIEGLTRLNLPFPRLVLNGRVAPVFDAQASQDLAAIDASAFSSAARTVYEWARTRAEIEAVQRDLAGQLAETQGGPVTVLPWVEAADTPEGIAELARFFALQ